MRSESSSDFHVHRSVAYFYFLAFQNSSLACKGVGFNIFGVSPSGEYGPPSPMMIVTDGKTSSGNDVSKLAPHTYNISLGAVAGLEYGDHVVQISSTGPTPRYLLVRGISTH